MSLRNSNQFKPCHSPVLATGALIVVLVVMVMSQVGAVCMILVIMVMHWGGVVCVAILRISVAIVVLLIDQVLFKVVVQVGVVCVGVVSISQRSLFFQSCFSAKHTAQVNRDDDLNHLQRDEKDSERVETKDKFLNHFKKQLLKICKQNSSVP